MLASPYLLQKKYARIVYLFAQRMNISLDEALRFFYHSETYELMHQGISDMHCRSDLYLVDELYMEFTGLPIP